MKIFFYLIFSLFLGLSADAMQEYQCYREGFQLKIVNNLSDSQNFTEWFIFADENLEVLIRGSGAWRKEIDSIDAFSSFDNETAISYNNHRAILVLPNQQVLLFPECILIFDDAFLN